MSGIVDVPVSWSSPIISNMRSCAAMCWFIVIASRTSRSSGWFV